MLKFKLDGSLVRAINRRFQTEQNGCYLCWKNFPTVDELKAHLDLHLISKIKDTWESQGNVEALCCNINLIAAKLIFELKNNTNDDVIVQFIGVFNDILQFGKLNPNEFPITLKKGDNITLQSPINGLSNYNRYVILFEESSQKHFEKIQQYIVRLKMDLIRRHCMEDNVENEEIVDEQATTSSTRSYTEILGANRIHDILKIMPLPRYEPSADVKQLCVASFNAPKASLPYNCVFNMINEYNGLTPMNYAEILSIFIQIEDVTARLAIDRNVKHDRSVIRMESGEFTVKLHKSEGRPLFLTKGDSLWVEHKGKPEVRIRGYVKKVSSEEIIFKLLTNSVLDPLPCYSIHFEVNRLTFQMERKALDDAKRLNVINLLFPSAHYHCNNINNNNEELTLPNLKFFDAKIKSDVNQIAAVKHIVNGTSYPLPYLLVGFPGTGKTKVIVESVCQLFTYPKNRILVCASSNNVCDEIAQKLIPLVKRTSQYQTPLTQQYNILRLYATSVRRSCKNDELLDNSNFDEKSIPCLDEIYKYRIVICTLTVCGRLAQGNIDKKHFTHLFIDECESASETYTLIPIVGICSSLNSINANIVLSGDPQQLGPIVRSNILKNLILSLSMFQRLYYSEPYEKNSKTGSYHQCFISKLKNNYRSHSSLVALPNKLFYNNEIRSCANTGHFKWLSELSFLPKRGFPILFQNIDGCPEKKNNCLSWFNDAEVASVLDYVRILLGNKSKNITQSDIGIISPYKRQCTNIEDMLEAENLTDIEVGSVEQFQGKEKPIIIISTVRKGKIGFMQDRERINVMITRAIGLLIIIGHKETLHKHSDWKKIIDYTIKNCE